LRLRSSSWPRLKHNITIEKKLRRHSAHDRLRDELSQVWDQPHFQAAQAIEGKGTITIETINLGIRVAVKNRDTGKASARVDGAHFRSVLHHQEKGRRLAWDWERVAHRQGTPRRRHRVTSEPATPVLPCISYERARKASHARKLAACLNHVRTVVLLASIVFFVLGTASGEIASPLLGVDPNAPHRRTLAPMVWITLPTPIGPFGASFSSIAGAAPIIGPMPLPDGDLVRAGMDCHWRHFYGRCA
jgi:hypothetical protein